MAFSSVVTWNNEIPKCHYQRLPDCTAMDTERNEYAFLLQYLMYNLLSSQHYQRVGLRDGA